MDHPPEVLSLSARCRRHLCPSHRKGPPEVTCPSLPPAAGPSQLSPSTSLMPEQLQGTAGHPTASLSAATNWTHSLRPHPAAWCPAICSPVSSCHAGTLWEMVPKCSLHTHPRPSMARPPSSPCRRRLGLSNTVSLTSLHLPFPVFFLVFHVFENRVQDTLSDLSVMRRI